MRYVYFIDKAWRRKLTVPEIPFSQIDHVGAGMYRGKKRSSAVGVAASTLTDQVGGGGAIPTTALHRIDGLSSQENQNDGKSLRGVTSE